MGVFNPKPDDDIGRMQFLLALRRRGIRDVNVLRAMETVPRELFVDPADRDVAGRTGRCRSPAARPSVSPASSRR